MNPFVLQLSIQFKHNGCHGKSSREFLSGHIHLGSSTSGKTISSYPAAQQVHGSLSALRSKATGVKSVWLRSFDMQIFQRCALPLCARGTCRSFNCQSRQSRRNISFVLHDGARVPCLPDEPEDHFLSSYV